MGVMGKRVAVTAFLLLLGTLLIVGGLAEISRHWSHPWALASGALLAAMAWVMIIRADIELMLRALGILWPVLPVVAFSVTSLFVGSSNGTVAFDEIGAQVIVVLLLALALEARFFHLRRAREPLELGAMLFTMLLLGSGEFYALRGVAIGHAEHADLIGGAIAAGFVAVAIAALTGSGDNWRRDQT